MRAIASMSLFLRKRVMSAMMTRRVELMMNRASHVFLSCR